MPLGRLDVSNVRNISRAGLELGPRATLLYGDNGSGKTSLLEAVYFLGSGRTFRSQSADPLIQRDAESVTVFGELVDDAGRRYRLGVSRGRDGSREVRINGETVQRTSDIARLLPILVLGPQTVDLVMAGPSLRRRFLNWGVFHVEHSFGELWEQYSRALRQRNQLLKSHAASMREIQIWSESLSDLAERVDAHRSAYIARFQQHFTKVSTTLMGENSLDSRYYRGWESGRPLSEVLAEQEASDMRRGFTQSGPHRADIRLRVAGQNAANVCSRGELKALAWSMVLAQGACFQQDRDATLIYLVDDLSAELDQEHRQRVRDLLDVPGIQVLVTGIDRSQLDLGWTDPKLFHVEHGQFHEMEMRL